MELHAPRFPFLDLARRGKNQWWRYVLFVALFILVVAVLQFFILQPIDLFLNESFFAAGYNSFVIDESLSNLTFIFLLLAFYIVFRLIHQRPFVSLLRVKRLRWQRIGLSFVVTVALQMGIMAFAGELNMFMVLGSLGSSIVLVPLILLIYPVQTSAEEIVFRGYALQSLGLITRRAIWPVLISTLLFMLLHAPGAIGSQFWVAFSYYIAFGWFFAIWTLLDDGMELALGVHAAVNITSSLNELLGPSSEQMILPTAEIIRNNVRSLVLVCVLLVAITAIFFGRRGFAWRQFFAKREVTRPTEPAAQVSSPARISV